MAAERKLVESKQRLSKEIQLASLANSTEEDKNFKNECFLSDATSSLYSLTNNASAVNTDSHQQPVAVPGHDGTNVKVYGAGSIHPKDESKISLNRMQSKNDVLSCYITGNDPCATRSMVGVDKKCIGPKPTSSVAGTTVSLRSRHSDSIKTSGSFDAIVPINSKPFLSAPSDLSKYSVQSQHFMSSNKVPQLGYDYRSSVLYKGTYSAKEVALSNHVQRLFSYGSSRYTTNGQTEGGYDGYKLGEKSNKNSNFEALRESTRGPRSRRLYSQLNLIDEKEQFGSRVRRDRYNRSDFQIMYDNAKFFIIKSYSEYDIHKSIKYDVWSSTPHGNRKLDAAFRDAVATYSEKGTRCPIFLFFSVNGSGQFLGLAEMTGPVDYEKDMDFWQQSKWSGFFPVSWHIIKDIPNNRLKHIILENNDNKPVTYTRDTQEVGLKQGLEMLSIFKSFSAGTSMLDDYTFYEEQEKFRQLRKSGNEESPEYENHRTDFRERNSESRTRKAQQVSMRALNDPNSFTSLAALARNLSLDDKNTNAGNNMRRY